MSRFNAPLDPFEMDEFDYPVFEAPPRSRTATRSSRPPTSTGSNSNARTSSPRGPQAPRRSGGGSPAPRTPASRNNGDRPATERSASPAAKRPTTNSGARPISKPRSKTPFPTPPRRIARPRASLRAVHYEVAGVLLVALGILFGYAMLQSQIDGWLPRHGLAACRVLFGAGTAAIPCALVYLGVLLFVRRQNANLRAFWRGAGVAFGVFLTWKALQVPRGAELADLAVVQAHGGFVGGVLAWGLRRLLGEVGAVVALVALALVAILLWTESTLGQLSERGRHWLANFFADTRDELQEKSADLRRVQTEKKAQRVQEREREQDERDLEAELDWREDSALSPRAFEPLEDEDFDFGDIPTRNPEQKRLPLKRRPSPFLPLDDLLGGAAPVSVPSVDEAPRVEPDSKADARKSRGVNKESAKAEVPLDVPAFMTPPRIEIVDTAPPVSVVVPVAAPPQVPAIPGEIDLKAVLAGENADRDLTPSEALELQAEESAREDESHAPPRPTPIEKPRRSFGDGPLMPEYFDEAVVALDPPIPVDHSGAEEEIQRSVAAVQETLGAFKIDARVTDVKRGPVITRYEVQPGPGVRVASIANLDKDLARSLSALAVRIEAPVPGKNVVGIEIPNKKVHLVRMRDVLEQPDFLAHQSKLAFVLGKDIAGLPKWGDLTKMPHMLIAGSTNSGKSVCLNSIIASILVRARPDEVRFSLIDPKRVELTLYRGIRHLMHDVVVEPKQAVVALRRSIEEMDRRYKLFATRQVRNIASYNAKLQPGEKPMPYIVIVIDELADLMMTAAAEFEKLICRLAQLARATGIHLIVATQRPSVNVITGVIKANIPARIAFAVASQVDSRTILDSVGAERLIGSGDMLYDANNGGKSTRIQGAFLSEEEVNRIVEVVKAAYQYEDDAMNDLAEFDLYQPDDDDCDFESEKVGSDEKRDSLFDEIVEFATRHQEMSASMIQRKFGIGYPRAGRIVDQLERAGILGPADGPKPRKVLRSAEE